ncbi:recombinase family protein [Paracoccus sp. pheM1]|uniref:recombinase family protein n=1 Tax=Paracoccus sp. pheM1 TaxID=2831675 RepID=UPI001F0B3D64|nr:recombinase family protein [Paracoccus sp. pheM1]
MMDGDLLPPAILQRKAVVYVRQSTPAQVELNTESRRRQYELVEVARRRGFRTVDVIDDDLGRSASGMVARPGFEKLVAALCAGEVGAVLCFDASRLARNGRDWHHLLELCGLVEARVIDLDGIYDPCLPNDRLLLGMKGSISEFELGVIRARMLDAARAKARRGELRISVPMAISGIARPASASIPTSGSSRSSGWSSSDSASSAAHGRRICRWRRRGCSFRAPRTASA